MAYFTTQEELTKSKINYIKGYANCERFDSFRHFLNSWSWAKENALKYCWQLVDEKHGYNGGIISCNGFRFTFGFNYVDDDGVIHFCYITRDYNYDIEL